MHARVDERHRRLVRAAETAPAGTRDSAVREFDAHTGPRPAFRIPCGSSACLTDAPSEPASPSGPQTSSCCFNCASARRTTTWRNTSLRDRRRSTMLTLRADIGVEPKESRAERGASNQLDTRDGAAQVVR